MNTAHKLRLALISTITFSLGLGWLFQHSTETLCYSKLGFVYMANVVFWLASIGPLQRVVNGFSPELSGYRSVFLVGVVALLLNQVFVYGVVEALFSTFYSCDSSMHFAELIQTNTILSNVISFGLIALIKKPVKASRDTNNDSSQINSPICIRQNGFVHNIDPTKISLLESDNNAVNIYADSKRYVHYSRLKDWEVKLEEYGLVRVHRSYLVNKNFIAKYKPKSSGDGVLVMTDQREVKVSRNYKANLYKNGQLTLHHIHS